jgi:hypothetical protein
MLKFYVSLMLNMLWGVCVCVCICVVVWKDSSSPCGHSGTIADKGFI